MGKFINYEENEVLRIRPQVYTMLQNAFLLRAILLNVIQLTFILMFNVILINVTESAN
jgi:hypothetical protein